MKKILFILSFSALFLSLLTFNPQKFKAAASYIEIQKKLTPIYQTRNGVLEKVGYLHINQQFPLVKDYGPNWFEIKFGNSYVFVNKGYAKVVMYPSYKNVNVKYKNSKTNIITIVDSAVYDNTSGKLIKFATIKGNRRYPILFSYGNWWVVDVSGRVGYMSKTGTKIDKGVPVLMYHHLLKTKENTHYRNSSTITPEQFKQEMDYLHQQGFETITTEQLEQYINGKLNLPGKTVLITFDDGLKSVYLYAYPVLKQNKMKATEFMITSRVTQKPSTFNPKGLQTLSRTEMNLMRDVFEFQGHTHNLHSLGQNNKSVLLTTPSNEIKRDLTTNKNSINATSFAYPFGQYNINTISILKQTGIKSAYTTKNGYVNVGDDVYQIKRFGIEPGMSYQKFKSLFN